MIAFGGRIGTQGLKLHLECVIHCLRRLSDAKCLFIMPPKAILRILLFLRMTCSSTSKRVKCFYLNLFDQDLTG